MTHTAPSDSTTITAILGSCRTIAVVGLSPKPHRASFDVSRYMQQQGYRIIPINPNASEILGEKAYASLTAAAAVESIDLVNVFRNSEDVPPVVSEAITIGAKAVWLQLGIAHAAAAQEASDAGMLVVQNKCLMVEHAHNG
jgi:predicted CoA-binding protein